MMAGWLGTRPCTPWLQLIPAERGTAPPLRQRGPNVFHAAYETRLLLHTDCAPLALVFMHTGAIGLSGTLPAALFTLPALKEVNLELNNLTGTDKCIRFVLYAYY